MQPNLRRLACRNLGCVLLPAYIVRVRTTAWPWHCISPSQFSAGISIPCFTGLNMSQIYKYVATTTADHPALRSQPRTITWWPKAAPILVVVPSALSIALLYINKHTYSGQLLSWSINNRGAIQVVIQVISSILSFFWLYSIRTVISQWTRYRLSGSPMKLNTLRLWSAISLATTNWDLPWSKGFVALVFFCVHTSSSDAVGWCIDALVDRRVARRSHFELVLNLVDL